MYITCSSIQILRLMQSLGIDPARTKEVKHIRENIIHNSPHVLMSISAYSLCLLLIAIAYLTIYEKILDYKESSL